jgi:hypothetical protein
MQEQERLADIIGLSPRLDRQARRFMFHLVDVGIPSRTPAARATSAPYFAIAWGSNFELSGEPRGACNIGTLPVACLAALSLPAGLLA